MTPLRLMLPNVSVRIKLDWHPVHRLRRWLKRTTCEQCGRRYRDMVEGCVGGEDLCGTCLKQPANQP